MWEICQSLLYSTVQIQAKKMYFQLLQYCVAFDVIFVFSMPRPAARLWPMVHHSHSTDSCSISWEAGQQTCRPVSTYCELAIPVSWDVWFLLNSPCDVIFFILYRLSEKKYKRGRFKQSSTNLDSKKTSRESTPAPSPQASDDCLSFQSWARPMKRKRSTRAAAPRCLQRMPIDLPRTSSGQSHLTAVRKRKASIVKKKSTSSVKQLQAVPVVARALSFDGNSQSPEQVAPHFVTTPPRTPSILTGTAYLWMCS